MCGIWCSIATSASVSLSSRSCKLLRRRGPDSFQCTGFSPGPTLNFHVKLAASVLSLRSSSTSTSNSSYSSNFPAHQPLHCPSLNLYFAWNGEAWSYNNHDISPQNDSSYIFQQLCLAYRSFIPNSSLSNIPILLDCLSKIIGPYAFVFYDATRQFIFFGRDPLGRRSLVQTSTSSYLIISSFVDSSFPSPWQDVEANAIYYLSLNQSSTHLTIHNIPYTFPNPSSKSHLYLPYPFANFNLTIPCQDNTSPYSFSPDCSLVIQLENFLLLSLRPRLHFAFSSNSTSNFSPNTPHISSPISVPPAKIAILFSGGLDCSILARLTHDILPLNEPIDLINVAFGNNQAFEACPDRITARKSLNDLAKISPLRQWRLICVNISLSEFRDHRSTILELIRPNNTEMDLSIAAALYFASRGIGSLNLVNQNALNPANNNYTTAAKILLSGFAADELFAGYRRHELAFRRGGYLALANELKRDFFRLPQRNLGRDDRVVAYWSKEVRYPYLDESLVNWAVSLPVHYKCAFDKLTPAQLKAAEISAEISSQFLDKSPLRYLALRLSLPNIAIEAKRAIQFGSRSAKLDGKSQSGTSYVT